MRCAADARSDAAGVDAGAEDTVDMSDEPPPPLLNPSEVTGETVADRTSAASTSTSGVKVEQTAPTVAVVGDSDANKDADQDLVDVTTVQQHVVFRRGALSSTCDTVSWTDESSFFADGTGTADGAVEPSTGLQRFDNTWNEQPQYHTISTDALGLIDGNQIVGLVTCHYFVEGLSLYRLCRAPSGRCWVGRCSAPTASVHLLTRVAWSGTDLASTTATVRSQKAF